MRWLSLVLLVACSGDDKDGGTAPSPNDTATVDPTTTPTGTSLPTDSTGSTASTGSTGITGDTGGGTGHTGLAIVQLSNVLGAVHPELGSLVEVSWSQNQPADVFVEYSYDKGEWHRSPARSLDAGPHEELLLGVPYGTDVTWRVVVDGGVSSAEQVTTTDPLPTMPVPFVNTLVASEVDADADHVLVSVTSASLGSPWWVLILDRQGRVVWARQSDPNRTSLHPRLSHDGTRILHDQNAFWALFSLSEGSVQKIAIDGTLDHEWLTPGLHHPHQEMPDGSLAYGAFTGAYQESLIVVSPNGSVENLWDCNAWAASAGASAFCASNTLNYDEATDTFLFSFWTYETVVQIDGQGNTLRWFGHAPGSYSFSPADSAFWFQHGAHLTPQGTLLISTHQAEQDVSLVAREYTIDTVNEQLVEVWNAGVDQGIAGQQMGDAYRTPGGHTLQTYGTQARMREYQPNGAVVWDVSFVGAALIGRATALPDLYELAPPRL